MLKDSFGASWLRSKFGLSFQFLCTMKIPLDDHENLPSSNRALSPREHEIVELSIQGLTNEAIAAKMEISIGTVNTYWLRIRLKVGGAGRTDTVAKVITERSDRALRAANVERTRLVDNMSVKTHQLLELRAA